MAIKEQDWGLSQRGLKDTTRHREKVKDAIRKNIAEVISEEAIITRKKDKTVRVPIRGLKSYRFIYDRGAGRAGIGQGEGRKGDVIGRRSKNGKPGKAGDEPGIDYLETEIDIEALIEMMFEDLGLPNLRKKEVAETVIPKGWTFDSVERHGLQTRLDKKRTVKEAVKRTASFVGELMARTGAPQEECEEALHRAKGDLTRAEEMLKSAHPERLPSGSSEMPSGLKKSPFLFSEDLRYRTLKEDIEYHSNAVVLAMMDVSGSMGTMKKYMARSFYFWLVEFLRHLYQNVEIRFIAHTTEAKLVDEYEFFHKGESGGTFCWTAYELALHLVDTEYNPERWNIYPFHFSDGEDWDPARTVEEAEKLIERGVNMVGYGEIQLQGYYSASRLMETFGKRLSLERMRTGRILGSGSGEPPEILAGRRSHVPFLGVVLRDRSDLYPALRTFLRKPDRDLLLYLINHSPRPLGEWQQDVLSVIRLQSRYFWPNMRTKIMNEGWAALWHQRIMERLFQEGMLSAEEHGYYNLYNARVLAFNRKGINPYLVGLKLFEDMEDRWNKGRFGRAFEECQDRVQKEEWDLQLGQGREKVFETRRTFSDRFFIEEFLTEELVERLDLYIYEEREKGDHIEEVIVEDDWKVIKEKLVQSLTDFGIPMIMVEDGDYNGARELYLKHYYEGVPLDREYREKTMAYIYYLWGRPVHLETQEQAGRRRPEKRLYCYDGDRHFQELKASRDLS